MCEAIPSTSSEQPKPDELSDFGKRLAGYEDTPLLPNKSTSSRTYMPTYLSRSKKFSFCLGHVINDIMGVLWFSYALTFLQIIIKLKPTVSASLLFFGQLIDAISTPFIGMMIDRFGSKQSWNALGFLHDSYCFQQFSNSFTSVNFWFAFKLATSHWLTSTCELRFVIVNCSRGTQLENVEARSYNICKVFC